MSVIRAPQDCDEQTSVPDGAFPPRQVDSKTQVQALTPSTRSKVKVRPFWFPIWKCIDYQQGCGFRALAAQGANGVEPKIMRQNRNWTSPPLGGRLATVIRRRAMLRRKIGRASCRERV